MEIMKVVHEHLQTMINLSPGAVWLITFANSLDQNQARQNVKPGLDPNCLTLRLYS